jgi:DNA polymerase-3 subunit delta'
VTDPFSRVVGQERAVDELRRAASNPVHAYLLVGPAGSGTLDLARAFAAAVLDVGDDGDGSIVDRVLAVRHPDVVEIVAEGAAVRAVEAGELRDAAMRSPAEAHRKVLIGQGFDVIQPPAVGLLLKTIEEPSPSTVIVLTASDVPPDLVTIASRCVRIDLAPVSEGALVEALRVPAAELGVSDEQVAEAAAAAGGDLGRARVLLSDPVFGQRRASWVSVPARLDGTGAAVVAIARELLDAIDQASGPLAAQQATERATAEEEVEQYGLQRGVLRRLDDSHKRALKRFRTQELRYGLAVLAGVYRDMAVAGSVGEADSAVQAIDSFAVALKRNPNERLQLEALLASLPVAR